MFDLQRAEVASAHHPRKISARIPDTYCLHFQRVTIPFMRLELIQPSWTHPDSLSGLSSCRKFSATDILTAEGSVDHIAASASSTTFTSPGTIVLSPIFMKGPSDSVRTLSRGSRLTIALPFSLSTIAGLIENKWPRSIARLKLLRLPLYQWKTTGREYSSASISNTAVSARLEWIVTNFGFISKHRRTNLKDSNCRSRVARPSREKSSPTSPMKDVFVTSSLNRLNGDSFCRSWTGGCATA